MRAEDTSLKVSPRWTAMALFLAAMVGGFWALMMVFGIRTGTQIWIGVLAILACIYGLWKPKE
jgi:hypothetical protein